MWADKVVLSSRQANVDCKAVRGQNLPSYWNAEVSAGVAGGRGERPHSWILDALPAQIVLLMVQL